MNLKKQLDNKEVKVSVPCRVDFGGTLDISTLFLPMHFLNPSSFNIALDMRTHVTLFPWQDGMVRISSKGFEPAEFERGRAPYDHPMGLMFCVANYFDAHGVHIHIESTSPPRSALGGSSCAAVAIIAAFQKALDIPINPESIAWLAHYLEASVAGVPCGMQDQLAAAFGGVNLWTWKMGEKSPEFRQKKIFDNSENLAALNKSMIIAYCGIPHVSKDINGRWVRSFISGESRHVFHKISAITKEFSGAVELLDFRQAAALMNQETNLRLDMTPDVLDETGKDLFEAAGKENCGARFTGAGGGGCLWAIGDQNDIQSLRLSWQEILESVKNGKILNTKIENKGIMIR